MLNKRPNNLFILTRGDAVEWRGSVKDKGIELHNRCSLHAPAVFLHHVGDEITVLTARARVLLLVFETTYQRSKKEKKEKKKKVDTRKQCTTRYNHPVRTEVDASGDELLSVHKEAC